jgi:hypothetical protein
MGPPQLAASVISNRARDVACWHIADNRGAATFCPLLDQSGQRWVLPRNLNDFGFELLPTGVPTNAGKILGDMDKRIKRVDFIDVSERCRKPH